MGCAGFLVLLACLLTATPAWGIPPAPGTPDPGFRPRIESVADDGTPRPGVVHCLAVQSDGRILVGGSFNRVNGIARTNLARINPDGSLDRLFLAGVDSGGDVEAIVLRPDGLIWLGGRFRQVNGQRRKALARIDENGGLDPRFELIPELEGEVHALAFQSDGKLVFGGRFEAFDLPLRPLKSLARLNVNGTLDDTFASDLSPAIPGFPGLPLPEVWNILPEGSERILLEVQGPLAPAGNASLWSIRPTGEREPEVFGSHAVSRRGLRVFRYPDGRLLVSDFGEGSGGSPSLYRYHPTGDIDPSSQPWHSAGITAAVILSDGRAVLGGFTDFSWAVGNGGQNVVRLQADGRLDPTFGSGTRIDGSVSVMALQSEGQLLLGGSMAGVNGISLAGLCRLYGGEAEGPVIVTPPQSQTLVAGMSATLQVTATGTAPLSYQWRNRDRNLRDQTNAVLNLDPVLNTETHLYSVQVSNAVGAVSSPVARLTVSAPTRIVQGPENLTFKPGNPIRFTVSATGPAPLSYSWYANGEPIAGAVAPEFSIDEARPEDAGEYWVEVSGPGGRAVSSKAFLRLRTVQAGDGDPAFAPGAGAMGRVMAVLPLANGSVVVGGNFTQIAGLPHRFVALLQTNGLPHPDFAAQLPDDFSFSTIAALSTGDILVSGRVGRDFASQAYLALLDAAGGVKREVILSQGSGAGIGTLAVQSDDRVLVGGMFQWKAGPSHTYVNLARFDAGLAPDLSFPTNLALNGIVSGLAVDASDRILVGGTFTELQHQPRTGVARLGVDGGLDPGFDAGAIRYLNGPGSVYHLAVLPDGGCYVSGSFDQVGGRSTRNIARLTATGAVDPGFGFSLGTTEHETIQALCVQPDGWLVLGGRFNPFQGAGITAHVLRLRPDGSVDESFVPSVGLSPDIACLAAQRDQKLLVGGDLVVQNPDNQRGITRLLVGEPTVPYFVRQPVDTRMIPGADALLWAEAEGSRRLGYQWEKDGQPVPGATNPPLILRQVEASQSGAYTLVARNGYGETRSQSAQLRVLEPPVITTLLSNQTVVAGQRVVLQVDAVGSKPLRYEWSRDGVWMRWVTGSSLTLDPVTSQDAAGYSVSVVNDMATARSPTFRLTVVQPPQVISQSTDRFVPVGSPVSLAADATGTSPLVFQWRMNGRTLEGQTNTTLGWGSVAASDAGSFAVVITNAWGSVTSAPIRLDVLVPPVIVRQPEDQSGPVGGTVTFEVQAAGQPFPTFQWLYGGLEIPGANGPALILTNLQPAQAGLYSVIAGSMAGTLQSARARLTLADVPPVLSNVTLSILPDGSFSVEASVLNGGYRIDASVDLKEWTVLWEGQVTAGHLQFKDAEARDRPRRYYRIVYTPL